MKRWHSPLQWRDMISCWYFKSEWRGGTPLRSGEIMISCWYFKSEWRGGTPLCSGEIMISCWYFKSEWRGGILNLCSYIRLYSISLSINLLCIPFPYQLTFSVLDSGIKTYLVWNQCESYIKVLTNSNETMAIIKVPIRLLIIFSIEN